MSNTIMCEMRNIPADSVVAVIDFGQNYKCIKQDEPQVVRWEGLSQVTVHQIISFFRCPDCKESEVVRREVIFLSDDVKHDSHAVFYFKRKLLRSYGKMELSVLNFLSSHFECCPV